MTALFRHYSAPHQLHAVLLMDAARWHTSGAATASIFSDAFRRAAHLAYQYAQHRRTTQKVASCANVAGKQS